MAKRPEPAPVLDRGAWISAGLRALGTGGVEAVRVEVLARTLGVTKGSFYWHFADRRALLDAMVAHWELATTTNVIAAVDADGGSGADRLRRLIALCFHGGGISRLESALRRWGSTDDVVRPILARVDAARIAYVADLLVAHGLGAAMARIRARLLYLVMIGELAWRAHGGIATPRRALDVLGELLLAPET
jgi:AcrR family transcriptional regulator